MNKMIGAAKVLAAAAAVSMRHKTSRLFLLCSRLPMRENSHETRIDVL